MWYFTRRLVVKTGSEVVGIDDSEEPPDPSRFDMRDPAKWDIAPVELALTDGRPKWGNRRDDRRPMFDLETDLNRPQPPLTLLSSLQPGAHSYNTPQHPIRQPLVATYPTWPPFRRRLLPRPAR